VLWLKRGLVVQPDQSKWWQQSHAQCPVMDPVPAAEGLHFVYFSSRDQAGRSHISRLLFDVKALQPVTEAQLVLTLGKTGCFDDSGVMPACVLHFQGCCYLYYIGWMQRVSVPYQNAIGLAQIQADGSLKRVYEGPLFPPLKNEPYFTGTVHVQQIQNQLIAYYLSCTGWTEHENGRMEPEYNIKIARSQDAVNWQRDAQVAIELNTTTEGGLASATVVSRQNQYLMWYCYRGKSQYRENIHESYRIGLASSEDGLSWQRQDQLQSLPLGEQGQWDSQMLAYPNVTQTSEGVIMLYNGNHFGKHGFGAAVLQGEL